MPPKRRMVYLWSVVIAIAVGLTLRWWNLGGESLWFDEAYTAWAASLPVGRLIEVVRVDNSPPLYYLLMNGWTRVFGDSEFALRAPSALAGSIALLITPWVVRRLFDNPAVEVAATALAAVSFLQLRYAHEARCYEMLGLLALLVLWALPRWCEERRRGAAVAIALGLAAMTWMHNMAWLYVGAFGVAMLVWPTPRAWPSRVLHASWPIAVVVALYLPWAATLARQVSKMGGGFWIPTPDAPSLYYTTLLTGGVKLLPIGYFLRQWFGPLQPALMIIQIVLAIAFVVVVASLLGARFVPRRRRAAGIAVAAMSPIFAAFVVSIVSTSVFTPKAFVPTAMLMPVLIAGAVALCPPRFRAAPWAAVGVLVLLSFVSVLGQFRFERKEDWMAAHAFLADRSTADTLLVFVGNDGELALRYYENKLGPIAGRRSGVPTGFFENTPPRAMQRVAGEGDVADLQTAIKTHQPRQIILVGCHMAWADPHGLTRNVLESAGTRVEVQNFAGVIVERYLREGSVFSPFPSTRRGSEHRPVSTITASTITALTNAASTITSHSPAIFVRPIRRIS